MSPTKPEKKQRPYLFIDGFNNFIRYFVANESVSAHSQPIGGIVGFIKTIYYLNEQFAPSKIFVAWETGGGSSRRRSLFSEYKSHRAKVKDFKVRDSGSMRDVLRLDENAKVTQLTVLNRLIKTTPVCQVFVPDVEADDVIAYLVKEKYANVNADKIIVSSDKDYYQLLDKPDVKIYDGLKKILITGNDVREKTGVDPRNFALAKAIVGDPSDNIGGIPGVGLKTAVKRLPALSDKDNDVTISQVIDECKRQINEEKSKVKVYQSIIDGEEILKRNWKLIYLNSSSMSASQIEKINHIVDNHKPIMNKLMMIKLLNANGINFSFDFDRFASSLQQYLIYR